MAATVAVLLVYALPFLLVALAIYTLDARVTQCERVAHSPVDIRDVVRAELRAEKKRRAGSTEGA